MELIAQGMTSELPIDEYHQSPAIGSTGLKTFISRSPAHYWSAFRDPDRKPLDKKAWRLGRAYHCAGLEPASFESRYVLDHTVSKNSTKANMLARLLELGASDMASEMEKIVAIPDEIKPSTKAGKELYADHIAKGQHPMPASDAQWLSDEVARMYGKDVLTERQWQYAQKMAAASRGLPTTRGIFSPALREHIRIEHTIVWRHPSTGLMLKIRPDLMVMPCAQFPSGLIVDWKSTTDASPSGFARQVWNLDYGLQAAFYTRVMREALGTADRPPFAWLAQENEAPWAAKYYFAPAIGREDATGAVDSETAFASHTTLLDYWDARIDAALVRFAECEATGIWPAYGDDPADIELPAWAHAQMDAGAES